MGERSWYAGGRGVALLVRLWRLSVRMEVRRREILRPPYVLALWHGRIIGSLMDVFDRGGVAMASRSNDGALAAGILEGLGVKAARGSSSKGGLEALDEMEEMMRRGRQFAALTVDGPRGPWRRLKPGVVALARHLELPLFAVTFSCRRPRLLRTWDRMVVPRPFSRVVVEYSGPWEPADLAGNLRTVARRVGGEMDAQTAALDREVTGGELWPPA
ncbi:MAG: DUF374 domain-containing protein [Thermoanaerobaculaceae bacterium]|nr:DUF374 domain-containing protein [Thermoanaerobaculaceae bacterium]TAM51675.1 MAG: DUF374 domain-containing protein [Acidobacteriota bacterium]